jgi:hypothetical protein
MAAATVAQATTKATEGSHPTTTEGTTVTPTSQAMTDTADTITAIATETTKTQLIAVRVLVPPAAPAVC